MQNYAILSFDEGFSIVKDEKLQIKYQLEVNYAIVYETETKQILLFPAKGDKVVLFLNEKIMKEIINIEGIPIHSDNFFLNNKNLILNWEDSSKALLEELAASIKIKLNKNIDYQHVPLITTKLKILIKGKSVEEIFTNYYLTFSALLGKILIDNESGLQWELFKYYDINPYYVPDIKLNERPVAIFKLIGDEILRRKIRLSNCLNKIGINLHSA